LAGTSSNESASLGQDTRNQSTPAPGEPSIGVGRQVGRWRARAQAALDALSAQPGVNRAKLAAIGYCFGGSTALELGRSGAQLSAIVSFHESASATAGEV